MVENIITQQIVYFSSDIKSIIRIVDLSPCKYVNFWNVDWNVLRLSTFWCNFGPLSETMRGKHFKVSEFLFNAVPTTKVIFTARTCSNILKHKNLG